MTEEMLLTRYERAWNLHDPGACAACFAVDGIREYRVAHAGGEPGDRPPSARGRRAIADHTARLMSAVPDLAVETVSAGYCSDQRLWVEWRMRGNRIEVLGAAVFWLSNAGFLEERLYWDTAFMGGLSADSPEPGGPPDALTGSRPRARPLERRDRPVRGRG